MTYQVTTREQAIQALFELLKASSTFVTASRRFIDPGQIAENDCPAIVFDEASADGEEYEQQGIGLPDTRTEKVKVILYTHCGQNQAIVPATVMNGLLEGIRAAMISLDDSGNRQQQTLGGIVTCAWIKGRIPIIPGDIDGNGMAIVPIEILMP